MSCEVFAVCVALKDYATDGFSDPSAIVDSLTFSLYSCLRSPLNGQIMELDECLEIVSLVGTLNPTGRPHLHVSLSTKDGTVLGGHLIELEVFTTAEIVLGEARQLVFRRELDARTGFPELVVRCCPIVEDRVTASGQDET